jgi:hypothetical protein
VPHPHRLPNLQELISRLKANEALYSNARAKAGIDDLQKLLAYCSLMNISDKVVGVKGMNQAVSLTTLDLFPGVL